MDKAQAQPLEACTKGYYNSYYKNPNLFTGDDDVHLDFHPLITAANGDLSPDGNDIVIENEDQSSKNVFFKTFHLSCKSDTYCGNKNYGGIVLYKYNEKTDWRTKNDTHCMSGYVVIQDTDSAAVERWKRETRGIVHGAVYRNTFGEKVVDAEVVGEGFSIRSGEFGIKSGVFNNQGDEYHHGDKQMCDVVAYCMRKMANNWKDAGPNSLGNRNFTVKELAKGYTKK